MDSTLEILGTPPVVCTPSEFPRMPKEYQDLVIHQLTAQTDGSRRLRERT